MLCRLVLRILLRLLRVIRRVSFLRGEQGVQRGKLLAAAAAIITPSLVGTTAPAPTELTEEPREDFLAQLKKKHSKTGEDSRFLGTVLGRDKPPAEEVEEGIRIEGWDDIDTLRGWGRLVETKGEGT